MKTKNLFLWIAALIIVILIVVITEQLANRRPSEAALAFFPGLSEETIGAVFIRDEEGAVTARRKGDTWIAYTVPAASDTASDSSSGDTAAARGPMPPASLSTGIPQARSREYPADSASIQSVIEKITDMNKDQLISTNPEKQEKFEVDTAKGLLVRVWDNSGEAAGSFLIGKNGPTWSNHYVRVIGSNRVYSVGGSIKYAFFTDIDRWKDKTIIAYDKELTQKLTLRKRDAAPIILEKSRDSTGTVRWTMVQPEKHAAKTSEVQAVIDELCDLTAAQWEEDTALTDSAMGLTDPELVVSAVLENGETREAVIGNTKGDEKLFWVRSKHREPVYLVNDYTVSAMDKSLADLKEEEKPDSTKAEGKS